MLLGIAFLAVSLYIFCLGCCFDGLEDDYKKKNKKIKHWRCRQKNEYQDPSWFAGVMILLSSIVVGALAMAFWVEFVKTASQVPFFLLSALVASVIFVCFVGGWRLAVYPLYRFLTGSVGLLRRLFKGKSAVEKLIRVKNEKIRKYQEKIGEKKDQLNEIIEMLTLFLKRADALVADSKSTSSPLERVEWLACRLRKEVAKQQESLGVIEAKSSLLKQAEKELEGKVEVYRLYEELAPHLQVLGNSESTVKDDIEGHLAGIEAVLSGITEMLDKAELTTMAQAGATVEELKGRILAMEKIEPTGETTEAILTEARKILA